MQYATRSQKKALKKEQKLAEKVDNKDKICLNQILKPVLFIIFSLVVEIVSFRIMGFTTASGSAQILPTYFLFDMGFVLVISAIMLCSRTWVANALFYFFVILHILLCVANAILTADFGYIFTWEMFSLLPEAFKSFDMSFFNIYKALLYASLFGILIAIPLVLDHFTKNIKYQTTRLAKPVIMLICLLSISAIGGASYGVSVATLGDTDLHTQIDSAEYLYDNLNIHDKSLRLFGTWGFYMKNLGDLMFSKYENVNKSTTLADFYASETTATDSAVLSGDNLIMIMLESYEWFAIDPFNTPNLWKLKTGINTSTSIPHGAVVMTNYYSNNKTNVSEDASLLGFMPDVNILRLRSDDLITAQYSLPNLFKANGYTTGFFHSWDGTFYNRSTVNKNMGFDRFYSLADFTPENKSTKFNYFNLEADFIDQFMDEIAPTDTPFMSFYTTVSTHGSYDVYNPHFDEYYDIYDSNILQMTNWLEANGYTYPTDEYYQRILRQYKTAAIDTDVMVGKLFDHLSANDILDSTTVVLFADHNAFYFDLSYHIKDTDKYNYTQKQSINVPLMIYSDTLGERTVDDFCNVYDIYPTVCELYGLTYNTAVTQGYNILSSDISESMHASYLTGFYDSKCYTKDTTVIYRYDGATDEDVERFKTKICKFYEKQKTVELLYDKKWKIS